MKSKSSVGGEGVEDEEGSVESVRGVKGRRRRRTACRSGESILVGSGEVDVNGELDVEEQVANDALDYFFLFATWATH